MGGLDKWSLEGSNQIRYKTGKKTAYKVKYQNSLFYSQCNKVINMSGSGFTLLHTAFALISDKFSPKHLNTVHLIQMFPLISGLLESDHSSVRTCKAIFYDHWFCNKPTTSLKNNKSSPRPGRAVKTKTGSSTVLQQNGTEEMLSRDLVCQLHKPWIISATSLNFIDSMVLHKVKWTSLRIYMNASIKLDNNYTQFSFIIMSGTNKT